MKHRIRPVTLTVAALVVLLLLASYMAHEMNETLQRIQRLSHFCRTAHAVQVPLVVQSCKKAMTPSLPVRFLLDEPECTHKLLEELKVRNPSIVIPRPSKATARRQNGSLTADHNTTSRSSQ